MGHEIFDITDVILFSNTLVVNEIIHNFNSVFFMLMSTRYNMFLSIGILMDQ